MRRIFLTLHTLDAFLFHAIVNSISGPERPSLIRNTASSELPQSPIRGTTPNFEYSLGPAHNPSYAPTNVFTPTSDRDNSISSHSRERWIQKVSVKRYSVTSRRLSNVTQLLKQDLFWVHSSSACDHNASILISPLVRT